MARGRRLRRLAPAAALLLAACGEEAAEVAPEPPAYSRPTPDYARAEDAPSPPAVTFTETAKAAGLVFRHETGAFGEKWMPETMGSGCALHDLDGDGDDDALLVNGAWWPGHEGEGPAPTSALFANDGSGSFTDVTAGSGVDVSVYGMGVTAADYDGDGDADLYLTTLGDNLLLRQDRPLRFADAAAQAGVAGETWSDEEGRRHPEWSTGAAWADVDGDGRPDLLVTNYVHWSPENDLYASFDGKSKSYATPQQYTGSTPRLYRNRGDGGFSDITAEAGLLLPHAKSMGVAADDFDADGRVDLVITNDTQPNFLLRNLGGGRFEEVGTAAGIGYDESGRARAGMGVDVADLSGDGVLAIGIGNFSREAVSLYRQTAAGGTVFLDGAGKSRLVQPTLPTLTFGLRFFDYDLDGRQDLILANGHIEPEINAVQREIAYAQPPQLFWNDGRGRLIDASAEGRPGAGRAPGGPRPGRGRRGGRRRSGRADHHQRRRSPAAAQRPGGREGAGPAPAGGGGDRPPGGGGDGARRRADPVAAGAHGILLPEPERPGADLRAGGGGGGRSGDGALAGRGGGGAGGAGGGGVCGAGGRGRCGRRRRTLTWRLFFGPLLQHFCARSEPEVPWSSALQRAHWVPGPSHRRTDSFASTYAARVETVPNSSSVRSSSSTSIPKVSSSSTTSLIDRIESTSPSAPKRGSFSGRSSGPTGSSRALTTASRTLRVISALVIRGSLGLAGERRARPARGSPAHWPGGSCAWRAVPRFPGG